MQSFEQINQAFSRQSAYFDSYEESNEILKWMRSQTREHLLRHLVKGANILELNAGTGLDAVFLAGLGYHIHCVDISEGMLEKLGEKVRAKTLKDFISYQHLSFTELDKLERTSFDHIFSNFGGLNCAGNLKAVFAQFKKILKPGGKVTLVIIPPVCPWELALAVKGNFKVAFRRLHKKGVKANIEGIKIDTYYYSVRDVINALGNEFKILEIQGLASVCPPPYMDNFPKSFPRLFRNLAKLDAGLSHYFPFNHVADHFILTAEIMPGK